MLIENRVALITGAERGIGLATAKRFAAEGANVFLTGRSEELLESAIGQITNENANAKANLLTLDVGDPVSVKNAFQQLSRTTKGLDILVANAGILDDALLGMITTDQIESVFRVNTYGVLYCAQYASRLMARGNSGSIINLASIMGVNGNAGQAVYGGSKAAVIGITKSLAKELAPQNIRVNAIAPGFIDTDFVRSLPDKIFAERLQSVKMGRAGSADEVAKVALFLASDLSSFVTGQVIGVDGGMVI